MKKFLLSFCVLAAMAACSAGADDDPQSSTVEPVEPEPAVSNDLKPIELTDSERRLVGKSNTFAFRFFAAARSNKSMLVSPLSVTLALGMLNNGAADETQEQINTVLGFGDTGADGVNDFCKKMLDEAPTLDRETRVLLANTIFLNKDYALKPSFLEKADSYYEAQPETRDFSDGRTIDAINQWASDHTEGLVPQVLGPEEFSQNAVSYLLNALYFKGVWSNPFDAAETRQERFDGGAEVPMMHQEQSLMYANADDCEVLWLPYGNGAYNIALLLPHADKTLDDVAGTLDTDRWLQLKALRRFCDVDVKLPRFETTTNLRLESIMAGLGMPLAFSQEAQFPNFCDAPTHIGLMKQVARLKLDEQGAEAAAVTVVGVELTSAGDEPMLPQKVSFHATRPFAYVISETSTGAVFFIGQSTGR